MSLAVVLNYCSQDKRFIHHALDQLDEFADQVIIAHADRHYDGTPETMEIEDIVCERDDRLPMDTLLYHVDDRMPRMWNFVSARYFGWRQVDPKIKWVLFLDADEIVPADTFKRFYDARLKDGDYDAYRLLMDWYFRSPEFRAKQSVEVGTLIVRNSALHHNAFNTLDDRHGLFASVRHGVDKVVGGHGERLVHHYSWVGTEEQLLAKAARSGHQIDGQNWPDLIRKEFAAPFQGRDFVHGYEFETVKPLFHL